tara:strand:+ start:3965 stop:4717 length:753 start_codon:yes stop_codon:yes gene_type:complete
MGKIEKTAYITGLTGNFTKMNPVDKDLVGQSYVYTTRKTKTFKKQAESNGWGVRYLDHLDHTTNLVKASIQSKDVKFCNFDLNSEKPLWEEYDYILYSDHKFCFTKKQVSNLVEFMDDKKHVCAVGEQGSNVFTEFFCATAYTRYVKVMDEMRKNIDYYIENRSWEYCMQEDKPMANMSYILWNTKHPKFRFLVDKLNEEQKKYQHPECQILFTLFMNDYPDLVQVQPGHTLIGNLERIIPEDLIGHKHY